LPSSVENHLTDGSLFFQHVSVTSMQQIKQLLRLLREWRAGT
jgi:hypothetical protein